jgi:crossover junction endodeoxyribonuclease RuvC
VSEVVFGIDPGSVVTGYGVISQEGGRLRYLDCGVIKSPSRLDFPERLRRIHSGLVAAIEEASPDSVAVESVFHAKHASSALKLGQARGVALLAAAQAEKPIHEYAPAQVKRAVTGNGRADKEQVRQMVETLLGRKIDLPADATDALAVAICHAHASPLAEALAEAGRRGRGRRR